MRHELADSRYYTSMGRDLVNLKKSPKRALDLFCDARHQSNASSMPHPSPSPPSPQNRNRTHSQCVMADPLPHKKHGLSLLQLTFLISGFLCVVKSFVPSSSKLYHGNSVCNLIPNQKRQFDVIQSTEVQKKEVTLEDLQAQLIIQQKKIDKLISLWTEAPQPKLQSPSISHAITGPTHKKAPTSNVVPPLKAMFFIDGTWLYYSVHERGAQACPFITKYGRGWQRKYSVDWNVLPVLVNRHLTEAVRTFTDRPVEIVRSSVFTSYKANTSPTTYRYKLFEDLKNANYDVHMMETVGKSEKCVDIQLAVDMLHHATEAGGSYDIAILLTGDKDFIPAVVRTRQKGKLISLVSVKNGCNRALVDLPGLRDFDVFWLDDHLDELVIRKEAVPSQALLPTTAYILHKVTFDYIECSGFKKVSSRDLGRYLKTLYVGNICFLEAIKGAFGSIYHFLDEDEAYIITYDEQKEDSNFWISMSQEAPQRLADLADEAKLSEAEKTFFETYSTGVLADKELMYSRTLLQDAISLDDDTDFIPPVAQSIQPEAVHRESLIDYKTLTKPDLKDVCRKFGLKVSGTKAELIERIDEHSKSQRRPTAKASSSEDANRTKSDSYLLSLAVEFLRANGGRARSRDMGRYFAANKGAHGTALADLKTIYGNLSGFFLAFETSFATQSLEDSTLEFEIILKQR